MSTRPSGAVRRRDLPVLVLDVGGVLLTDPMPILFSRLAQAGERPKETIRRFYLTQLRDDFWAGRMAEDEFWSRLLCASGLSAAETRSWRDELLGWQTALPAVDRLAGWADRARIVLLSNHRTTWVRPALAAAGVTIPPPREGDGTADGPGDVGASPPRSAPGSANLVEQALISEETGLVKPDTSAFAAVLDWAGAGARCLLVDDQSPNVAAAAGSGLPALLADPEGRWIEEVDARLS